MGEPHTKKLNSELFEVRSKAKDGIARAIYTYEKDKVILILIVFMKKSQKTPINILHIAKQRLREVRNGND